MPESRPKISHFDTDKIQKTSTETVKCVTTTDTFAKQPSSLTLCFDDSNTAEQLVSRVDADQDSNRNTVNGRRECLSSAAAADSSRYQGGGVWEKQQQQRQEECNTFVRPEAALSRFDVGLLQKSKSTFSERT